MKSKVALSLIQPSGDLTIGNYLGALKHFPALQAEYNGLFGVADLHSITVPQKPADLRRRTLEVLAYMIAAGVDPKESVVFVQSHVPAHLQLAWVLNSMTYMGQLSRMTQFKDKARKSAEHENAALFTYPVLMAADILIYNADIVPVGDDQRQHIEMARDLAERFNHRYSDTFVVPEGRYDPGIGRVMSLKDPAVKMSKSDPDVNAYILLKDDRDTIIRKVKKAVTDSSGEFRYSDEQPGLKNLIELYRSVTGQSVEEIVRTFENSNYASFKEVLGERIADTITPIHSQAVELLADKTHLEEIYREGAEKAGSIAYKTLSKVYRKVGFLR